MGRQANKLKVEECHEIILLEFSKFKEKRPIFEIPLQNFLMSSFAVFALKSPSLLQFENQLKEHKVRMHNLNSLFKIDRVPSDTHLRDILETVEYTQYRPLFQRLFSYIQRSKALEQFEFMRLNGQSHYLLATDGSGYFRSEKLVCDCCMIEEHFDENNKMTLKFGHNILAGSIVHPDLKQVIPMCPEPIMRLDGVVKMILNKQHLEDF